MRRGTSLALALVLAATAGAQAQPDPKSPLTTSPGAAELSKWLGDRAIGIDDAVKIALATNRNLATSVANLDRVRGRTATARTALNPTAGLSGTLTEYDKANIANLGGSQLPIINQFEDVYSASVTLPIDIAGAARTAISQAQFTEVAARIDVNRVRNEIVFAVRSAFFQALRAKGQLVVAEDNYQNALTRLTDAQAILKAGTGTQFDVLTAQRDVADAEQAVVVARGVVTTALAQLKNTVGIDVSTPIRLTDRGAVEEPAAVTVTPPRTGESAENRMHEVANEVTLGPDYDQAVQTALATRPEVLESEAAITAARRGVAYARRSQLPSLSVGARYVVQPNAAGFTPEHQGAVQVSLSIPVFDGGLARARRQEAEAGVAAAEVDRRTARDQVTLDVQQAYVNLVQARERVQVATVGLAQAREAFRLARLRSQVGVTASPQLSPQLELSNAQTTLTQAETNRVNALYDYNIAKSQLERATGQYSYGQGPGFTQVPTAKQVGYRD